VNRSATTSRPKLGRATVVDAALRVADAEGLDAVTIRRLAHDLGVTPMALYWHFADKEALLDAVADRLWDGAMADLSASAEPADPWEQLRHLCGVMVDAMRRHPAVAERVSMRVVTSDSGLAITERALGLLASVGFGPEQASAAAHFILLNTVTLVSSEPGAEIGTDPHERDAVVRGKRVLLATLAPDRYPHVVAAADFLVDCGNTDEYYGRGLDMVIGGVRSQVPHLPSRRRRA
jgi:TetR/AcrR family tetracycline transcriptional repressor